jgi:para-nitrobenzyl esterase
MNRRELSLGLLGCLAARELWSADLFKATGLVRTTAGPVRGLDLDGVLAFRGIRYGRSTAGEARFRPPREPEPSTAVFDAFDYGPTAPQQRGSGERASFSSIYASDVAQSEDCLRLNVWTPAAGKARRPVMVWLHGGAFTSGSASAPVTNGAELAKREDVVVVSLNHRLNVLGYLDVGALDPEFASAVNVGMLDIVAALKWVRDNIEKFGGDPARVLVFGESGGSLKVATLLTMPAAQGLFHVAAMQSGAYITARTREQSKLTAEALRSALGLEKADGRALQRVPIEQLLKAAASLGPNGGFASTVDGDILPRHPFEPDATPLSAAVPLIIGSTRTETTYINAMDREGFNLDAAGLARRVGLMFEPAEATAVLDSYKRSFPQASPSDLYHLIATDQWLTIASAKIAERKAALQRAPVWLYRFDWQTPVDGGKWRAPHTIEIPFVFQTARLSQMGAQVGPNPDLGLATRMSRAWASLARSGNPNHRDLPDWPAYSLPQRPVMLFDSNTRVVRDPDAAQRQLLEPIVFRTSAGRGDRALAVRSLIVR